MFHQFILAKRKLFNTQKRMKNLNLGTMFTPRNSNKKEQQQWFQNEAMMMCRFQRELSDGGCGISLIFFFFLFLFSPPLFSSLCDELR
jgi:hypothetical protein